MARDIVINGETMVSVKGSPGSNLESLTQLGLAESGIILTPDFRYDEIQVDAWGEEIPMDVQFKLAAINIGMNLIHYDKTVLQDCLVQSMGGVVTPGRLARAGQRLGGGNALLASGNYYVQVSLSSPVSGLPWRFFACYMVGPPMTMPLGTKRSIVQVNWRCIPYTVDPWGGGTGALNYPLWDHTAAT